MWGKGFGSPSVAVRGGAVFTDSTKDKKLTPLQGFGSVLWLNCETTSLTLKSTERAALCDHLHCQHRVEATNALVMAIKGNLHTCIFVI